jgi:hypothetical protein
MLTVLSSYEQKYESWRKPTQLLFSFPTTNTAHLHTLQHFLSPVNYVLLEGLGHMGNFRRYKIKSVLFVHEEMFLTIFSLP